MTSKSKPETSKLTLLDPLTVLKGVSTVSAHTLSDGLGLHTIGDIFKYLPVRYEDRNEFSDLRQAEQGQFVTVRGRVLGVENVPTRSRVTLTKVLLEVENQRASLVFFNQWFLKKQFERLLEKSIVAYGRLGRGYTGIAELTDVEWEDVGGSDDTLSADRIVPVYGLTEGVSQARIRKLVSAAVSKYASVIEEWVPDTIAGEYNLLQINDAWSAIHFPSSKDILERAKYRVAFEEFFVFQLWLTAQRLRRSSRPGIAFTNIEHSTRQFEKLLPFQLTPTQNSAIREISNDMMVPHPMRRLLQGDVGSGKTVVAAAAMFAASSNGYQSAMMVPTEILAQQHYNKLVELFRNDGPVVALLTGSLSTSAKASVTNDIASGRASIVVGTHALIQDAVSFQRLGLVVVDEQHRFGVEQRSNLRDKGVSPHTLAMTATPIPRSLSLTVYGDLDVTTLTSLPAGRKTIRTHWKTSNQRENVYRTAARLINDGNQAFIVCSLINDNENLQALAAVELAEDLKNGVFANLKVGLLHGQMKALEKEAIMERFRGRDLDVLVATSVIEVGVDVPNATIIVVENADRFGMAQLHQLRGRVGRGEKQSFCILIGDPKSRIGARRLDTLARTNDGFEIAEEDLKLRGPGDLYGIRQSGMLNLHFFDVSEDIGVLYDARDAAQQVLSADQSLTDPANQKLKAEVRLRSRQIGGARAA